MKPFFAFAALIAGCAAPGSVVTQQTTVEDGVVFHFSVRGHRHSMSILNLGPGPVEVRLGEGQEHTHPIEIPEGTFEYVRPGDHESLEIRHPGEGAGRIEWTILEDLRDEVELEVPASR
jgi:hypothetical protein